MPFKPAVVILDCVTGYFELGIQEQSGDSAKLDWGQVRYGPLMANWRRDISLLRQLAAKGIIVVVVGHTEPDEMWYQTGERDPKGKPISEGRTIGWKLMVPGKGDKKILVPFDECYYLATIPNEAGINPNRVLYTNPISLHGFSFEALKSRKGVKGPISNPTWAKIMENLPKGKDVPKMFAILGSPGSGKSTLANTFTGNKLYLDLQGGCDEFAKQEDSRVLFPSTLNQVCDTLKLIRDKGELP